MKSKKKLDVIKNGYFEANFFGVGASGYLYDRLIKLSFPFEDFIPVIQKQAQILAARIQALEEDFKKI